MTRLVRDKLTANVFGFGRPTTTLCLKVCVNCHRSFDEDTVPREGLPAPSSSAPGRHYGYRGAASPRDTHAAQLSRLACFLFMDGVS